jgi:hypothetical protein
VADQVSSGATDYSSHAREEALATEYADDSPHATKCHAHLALGSHFALDPFLFEDLNHQFFPNLIYFLHGLSLLRKLNIFEIVNNLVKGLIVELLIG